MYLCEITINNMKPIFDSTMHNILNGRSIGIDALNEILKLKIEDYSNDMNLRVLIREYNDLICQYILRCGLEVFLHSRKFI
jgi:hypothetical protein